MSKCFPVYSKTMGINYTHRPRKWVVFVDCNDCFFFSRLVRIIKSLFQKRGKSDLTIHWSGFVVELSCKKVGLRWLSLRKFLLRERIRLGKSPLQDFLLRILFTVKSIESTLNERDSSSSSRSVLCWHIKWNWKGDFFIPV